MLISAVFIGFILQVFVCVCGVCPSRSLLAIPFDTSWVWLLRIRRHFWLQAQLKTLSVTEECLLTNGASPAVSCKILSSLLGLRLTWMGVAIYAPIAVIFSGGFIWDWRWGNLSDLSSFDFYLFVRKHRNCACAKNFAHFNSSYLRHCLQRCSWDSIGVLFIFLPSIGRSIGFCAMVNITGDACVAKMCSQKKKKKEKEEKRIRKKKRGMNFYPLPNSPTTSEQSQPFLNQKKIQLFAQTKKTLYYHKKKWVIFIFNKRNDSMKLLDHKHQENPKNHIFQNYNWKHFPPKKQH